MAWPFRRRKDKARAPRRLRDRVTGFFRACALTLGGIVLLTGVVWVIWAFVHFLVGSDFFALKDVLVTGVDIRTEVRIRRTLTQAGLREGDQVRLGTDEIRALAEGVPKVHTATVRKQRPGRIVIDAEPRQVTALLLHDPILAVDRERVVVETFSSRHPSASRFPYISGIDPGRVVPGDVVPSERLDKSDLSLIMLAG